MSSRTTLALLVLAIGLIAVLLMTDERPDPQGNVSVPVLAGGRLGSASVIRWQFAERPWIEIRRDPGGPFRLTEPLEDLASVPHLHAIAVTWDSAQMAEAPLADTEENRRNTGLDQPRLLVDVKFADGGHDHLEIGGEGALGTDLFVRSNGRIYRGGTALFSAMQVGIDDLRDRTVFTTPAAVVTELKVDRAVPGGRELLHLASHAPDWELLAPIRTRADGAAAAAFVRHVLALRIDQFPASVVRPPEREHDLVVTVRGGPGEETVRMWITEQRDVIGKLEARDITFVSNNQQYDAIFQNAAAELRARMLVPIEGVHENVTLVVVDPGEGAGERIVLARDQTGWTMREPWTGPAAPTPVQELLTAVNNLRALQFLPGVGGDPQFGFAGLRVGVQDRTRREPVWVRLGGDGRLGEYDVTYATRGDVPDEVCAVPKGAADEIRRPWTRYVPLEIVRIVQEVRRVDLQRGEERRTLAYDSERGWLAAGQPRDEDWKGAVEETVEDLRDLHGDSVRLLRTAGLGEPDWTLAMGRAAEGTDTYATLRIWDREGEPLLVQHETARPGLVFAMSKIASRRVRALWQ